MNKERSFDISILAIWILPIFGVILFSPLIAEPAESVLQGAVQKDVRQTVKRQPGYVGLDLLIRPAAYPQVKVVFDHSPAQAAGILPGDIIVGVNNQSMMGKSAQEVDLAISDIPGTTVQFLLYRHGLKTVAVQVQPAPGNKTFMKIEPVLPKIPD